MNNKNRNKSRCPLRVFLLLLMLISAGHPGIAQKKTRTHGSVYARQNLIAWCIVPFDSKKRGPEERAQMLNRLGITKLAYDWRQEHIPAFDQELEALKKHNIELQGFWFASGPNPENDKNLATVLALLKRHQVKTQLWCMFGGVPNLDQMSQQEKVQAAAVPVAYVARKLAEIGCSLGLYNHGGWFGEPENQLAIINYLKMPNIGMVYNFSHAEYQIRRFPEFYPKILPHLYALNLTGLKGGHPAEVVPVGQGNIEEGMMRLVQESSYKGPIGIINENFAPDAEAGLEMNIEGMKKILQHLGDKKALKTYN
jgi:sugar phosphate isomerase/epimerase